MQENCQSGSEGGAKLSFVPTPISAQGFNPGNPARRRNRPERAADLLSTVQFTKEPQNLGLVAIFAEPGIPG